jgi:protein TonB
VAPVYPAAARAAGIGGVVELDVSVDETGRVVKVDAVSGHALLRAAAADAVGRWRYEPALVEGLAVASQGRVTLTFEGR